MGQKPVRCGYCGEILLDWRQERCDRCAGKLYGNGMARHTYRTWRGSLGIRIENLASPGYGCMLVGAFVYLPVWIVWMCLGFPGPNGVKYVMNGLAVLFVVLPSCLFAFGAPLAYWLRSSD